MAKGKYIAEDIKILEGLDAVRMRPGMYIGSTGARGLHHILWEIVDNAIDECANGFADTVKVNLYKDGSASVEDNGRGIPTDIHPKMGVSGVEVVFTQLHAGGKFGDGNYNYSGGLHGVGASVTNALSEWLKVEVYKKTVHTMEFKSYLDKETGKVKSGVAMGRLKDTGKKTTKKGTFVHFMPDATVFETIAFSADVIQRRLKELAFLNKGVNIEFSDLRGENPVTLNFKYDGGLVDFVKYVNDGKNCLYKEPLYGFEERDGIVIEFAIQHTDSYTESVFSYVNNIPTPEGGTHETGFRSGLTRVLNDVAKEKRVLKDGSFLGDDFREGLTAILSIKMKNVQFEGQTKTKLGNPEARMPVETTTHDVISELTRNKKLSSVFDSIMQKALMAAKVRLAARKAKEIARASKSLEGASLVGKLAGCSGRKAEQNELFIVEGDSAGGSAKQARVRQYQAILPLRGKPLNVEKKKLDQILQNEEIRTIISALGTGIAGEFDISGLKYDKIIILADADDDGAHIRAILLTFFYRYMKQLVSEGHVYIGMPPLYKVYKKDVVEYAYDDKELPKVISKVGKGYMIQRYKGLGEMDPEQLWDTTMNPETRSLTRVTIDDATEAERLITTLMGDQLEERKKYIAEHADFNKVDGYKDLLKK
ncbi:MAG: DNA gyrase subunit B [Clostridia bacterium]|nr:DNA gyrase subunit B [Clostridia bacterium]